MTAAAGSCALLLALIFGPMTWIKRDVILDFWADAIWGQK